MDEPVSPAGSPAAGNNPQPAPPTASAAAATPVRTGLGLLRPLLGVLLLGLLLLGGAAVALRWMLVTADGSLWLLQHAPMVRVQGFSGALLGDRWQAKSLRVEWGGGQQWLLIEDLQAEGLNWLWRPDEASYLGLKARQVTARKLTLHTGPAGKSPVELPTQLAPPLHIEVAQARLAELQIDALPPWRALEADGFTLDPRPGQGYAVERLAFEAFGVAVAGTAHVDGQAPQALTANATLRPLQDGDAPRWAAVLSATGNLVRTEVSGTLRGVPQPALPAPGSAPRQGAKANKAEQAAAAPAAPAIDLHATLQAQQAWPLAALSLRTEALDLSALQPGAPATRLSGHAEFNAGGRGRPLSVALTLDNAQPGRWNEQRLPLQRVLIEARGQLARPDRLEVSRFDLALADAAHPAGRWTGTALWQGHELTIDTVLASVTPQRLDGRAAAMTLSGPLALTAQGLPAPDALFGAKAAATATAVSGAPASAPAPSLGWKLDLQGKLDATPQSVQLQVEGSLDHEHLDISRLHAQSGEATADLRAAISRVLGATAGASPGTSNTTGWKLATSGKLIGFDPVPWWQGDGGTPWRKGPHRLSGAWQLEARLPPNPDRLAHAALLQRVAGNGSLSIQDSLLAGVPLAAELTLGYSPADVAAPGKLHLDLRLGGNQLLLDGRGDPNGNGDNDHWRAELKAEQLASWAPLARLAPALAGWVPRQGSAQALVNADGRWPALRTDGHAELSQLQAGTLSLARGQANWRFDLRGKALEGRGDQPLALQLDLAGLQLAAQRADNLHFDLKGTLASHSLEVSGALPVMPPRVAEQVLGIQVQSGTRLQMRAQGGWKPEAGGGGRWQAQAVQFQVGSWDGSNDSAQPASGWAEASGLNADLRFNADGALLQAHADPGHLRLANTVTLSWEAVDLDLQGDKPQLQLRAEIEPFALAPLLARAWPSMGWQGDLRLAARVDIRAGEKVDADLVFERRDGDLHLASGEGVQLLGLSEFRLAVAAHEGLWVFTPTFRGRSLGDISGQARLQTTADARWPQPDAALGGQLQIQVADIGIWGAWVPPGWHFSGALNGAAALGGTFGKPQYTGQLTGKGLGLRNLLEGVNVSEGQLAIQLDGESARVEAFSANGGDGTLKVTGSATFADPAQARLQIQADHFRVLGRIDRQLIVSGKAELVLLPAGARLDGRLSVDEGLFDASRSGAPTLDEDVSVRRPGAPEGPQDAAAPGARRNVDLNVDIDMGEKLRVRGRGLDTTLRGQVRLTTPGGKLAVNGSISTEGGTYAAYGQKLEIERGNIIFSGSADNPRLDVLALRPNLDTRVGVSITGNLLTLRIKLFSEPDMADVDKLSWLVLGRAPDSVGRNDTALLQRAAVALLAGEGEAPTDAILKNLGITDLSLRQGDTDVRETIITVGKQINRRVYVGYERGVNATTGTWQLTYRIAQSFTLRLQTGLDTSVDVIWTWRFQPPPADAATRKQTAPAR
jgi:translocation and assembly module TamB